MLNIKSIALSLYNSQNELIIAANVKNVGSRWIIIASGLIIVLDSRTTNIFLT
jgi:hypothetical protein